MSHLLTDHRHFASQLSSVHWWLLERIFLTFSPALETLTYLLILPATHFNSHLQMHSHYCVNHFLKHVAVCSGACSFLFLHFYFKQHHRSNLLSVIATKLCQGNLLPSVGYASMDMEPAASFQFSSCNERGQLLFVKQHSCAECTYCKVPNAQQPLFHRGVAPKAAFTDLQDELSLCLSFIAFSFLPPSFQRKGGYKHLTSKSAPKKAAVVCYCRLPSPLL